MRVRSDSMRANFCLHQAAIAAKLTPSVYKYPQSASPSRLHAANQTLISRTIKQGNLSSFFFSFSARARPQSQPRSHSHLLSFLGEQKTRARALALLRPL